MWHTGCVKAQGLTFGLELLFQPKPLYVLGKALYIKAICCCYFICSSSWLWTHYIHQAASFLCLSGVTIKGGSHHAWCHFIFSSSTGDWTWGIILLGIALPLSHIPRFNITFCWRVLWLLFPNCQWVPPLRSPSNMFPSLMFETCKNNSAFITTTGQCRHGDGIVSSPSSLRYECWTPGRKCYLHKNEV